MMSSRPFLVLLVLVAIVGVVVSLASWCFLELIHQIQQEVFVHLPHAFGYSSEPRWWPLPILPIAAFITAVAIEKLPGRGGHIPANGLATGGPPPTIPDLSSVLLAAFATIGLGLVLGPEAPLIALGSGLGAFFIRRARKEAQPQVVTLVAAAGSFAAVAFVFSSPLIAAVILIEASGIGGARLPLLLVPGLLAAGIGSLVSLGMGSFTGLSTSAYALSALPLPSFGHPHIGNFAWSIALAIAIAAGAHVIMRGGKRTYSVVSPKPFVLLPVVGLAIAGLAILFSQITGKGTDEILFSGQDQLPGLISAAGTYSVGALALVVGLKGIAYSLSLGSFRGGPTFPIPVSSGRPRGSWPRTCPAFRLRPRSPSVWGLVSPPCFRLPLTAVVTASVLTAHSGAGAEPLVIVGVVVAYVVTLLLSRRAADPAPAHR